MVDLSFPLGGKGVSGFSRLHVILLLPGRRARRTKKPQLQLYRVEFVTATYLRYSVFVTASVSSFNSS